MILQWYTCPYCRQKLFKIAEDAVIKGLQIKCKSCKRIIDINMSH